MSRDDLAKQLSATWLEEPASPQYAVAMIFDLSKEKPHLLFIERAKHNGDHWSGDIAFPGGKREAGDANLVDTAIRETYEEIGVKLSQQDHYLGYYKTIPVRRRGIVQAGSLSAFVFAIEEDYTSKFSYEVESLFVKDIDELLSEKNRTYKSLVRKNVKIQIPGIKIEDHVLWGMTYSLFANFVHDLKPEANLPLY